MSSILLFVTGFFIHFPFNTGFGVLTISDFLATILFPLAFLSRFRIKSPGRLLFKYELLTILYCLLILICDISIGNSFKYTLKGLAVPILIYIYYISISFLCKSPSSLKKLFWGLALGGICVFFFPNTYKVTASTDLSLDNIKFAYFAFTPALKGFTASAAALFIIFESNKFIRYASRFILPSVIIMSSVFVSRTTTFVIAVSSFKDQITGLFKYYLKLPTIKKVLSTSDLLKCLKLKKPGKFTLFE